MSGPATAHRAELRRVCVGRSALLCCLAHALSTEAQEVMGLLLGSTTSDCVQVELALVMPRKDRKKDRVEVSYDALTQAATVAEKLQTVSGRACRVVGWYHSHPHITVQPSHVDVKTQGGYQYLDQFFVGLIFSVFATSGANRESVSMCAFQAVQTNEGGWERKEIPVEVTSSIPSNIAVAAQGLVALQEILMQEAATEHRKHCGLTAKSQLHDFNLLQQLTGAHEEPEASCGDPVDVAFYSAVYTKALALLVRDSIIPTRSTLQSQLESLKLKREALREQLRGAGIDPTTSTGQAHVPARAIIGSLTTSAFTRTRRNLRRPHEGLVSSVEATPNSSELLDLQGKHTAVQVRRASGREGLSYICSLSGVQGQFELLKVQPADEPNTTILSLRPVGGRAPELIAVTVVWDAQASSDVSNSEDHSSALRL